MTEPRDSAATGQRRRIAALPGLAAVALGVLLGVAALVLATRGDRPDAPQPPLVAAPAPASQDATPAVTPAARTRHPAPARRRASPPARIVIPAIGVRARVIRLGLNRDGSLEVPRDFAETGWWSGGSRPGERGPAVIAGHVDSRSGPAVFFRLGALRPGDVIRIARRDGSDVRFAVHRLARYAKTAFPTAQVYGPTRRPTLRLITCSGSFDRASGHYVDNTVVYATLMVRR